MPFRATFDCLWCGTPWQTRTPSDLEGWAALCAACLGRAGDNPFLAFRLRAGLTERSRAATGDAAPTPALAPTAAGPVIDPARLDADLRAWFEASGSEWDDRYLRRGRYSRGPVRDLAWEMELDTVTGWLDRLALAGEIVELAAGTGWWSTLLSGKGELSLYDTSEAALDVARRRLVAHGLLAHLHVRDAWAEPDRAVDAVFTGHWLSLVPDGRLPTFLELVLRWLRPGGTFAFIDRLGDPDAEAVDDPAPVDSLVPRRLPDGTTVRIPQVARSPESLRSALVEAGFGDAQVTSTGRFFVMGVARRPAGA
jgi:demethylmenaquinone methyltransferase/2-methoxy-6-polyprenyl-1,4-benzoquinol methylase